MLRHADAVAECVLKTFSALPTKAKPRLHPNGAQEWVPLSGLVLSRGSGFSREYKCISLGTGMRCLPATKVPLANGLCLHDWHAEVVAVRAFNHHLLTECLALSTGEQKQSDIIQFAAQDDHRTGKQPFTVREDVKIHMYSSEAPCGDASMELIMDAQQDPTPWHVPPSIQGSLDTLTGRGYFSQLGKVRRKPGRADAPPTLSKSCSDKLAMKQCSSLLSSLGSLLISPKDAYLADLILPATQISEQAIQRAFSSTGRMAGIAGIDIAEQWEDGYAFRPFNVSSTEIEFDFSRRSVSSEHKATPSNISAVWTPSMQQIIIGGTVQGFKQFAARGASEISRSHIWKLSRALAKQIQHEELYDILQAPTYSRIKDCSRLAGRRRVKRDVRTLSLQPWTVNSGDDYFTLQD